MQTDLLVSMGLKYLCQPVSDTVPWETLTPFCTNPGFSVEMEDIW